MAVYAAHLTRTLQGTPSIFQITAAEALGSTVKPALRKVFEYLAAVYPDKCEWSLRWYDELYLLFDTCLQHHYLTHYAASFSETFYGLLRVPLTPDPEFSLGQRLPASLERGSLLLLVLWPYLRDRAERLVQQWREDDEDGLLGKSAWGRARALLARLHSALHLSLSALALCQLAGFLCRRARCPTLGARLLRVTLANAPSDLHDGNSASSLAVSAGSLLLRAVEYGAFLVQLLRWWDTRAPVDTRLPAPSPPERDERSLRWKNKCPLCQQPWRIPAVLPVSGFVFCYTCISRHLRAAAAPACPVTSLPAREQDLLRLYLDH